MLISIGKFFLDPFNLLWMLTFVSMIAWYLDKKKLLKWLLCSLTIFFLVIATPLVPGLVISSLEDCYEPLYMEQLENPENEFHIIVLGGGHGFDDRLPPNSLLSQKALVRLNEGIRLHRQLPNSKLVLSGFSASGRTTQAEMLQKTALLLGVDPENTLIQKEPGNTNEEATFYFQKFGNSYPVILVTGAAHMPRAVKSFRRVGIEAIPSPTNYRLKNDPLNGRNWIPSIEHIANLRTGLYEYAAMLRDRLYF